MTSDELKNLPEWESALLHLEQNHPQYLAQLLKSQKLSEHLNQKVRDCLELELVLQKRCPKASRDQIVEMRDAEMFPVNPNEEQPLNPQEQNQLEEFKRKNGIQ